MRYACGVLFWKYNFQLFLDQSFHPSNLFHHHNSERKKEKMPVKKKVFSYGAVTYDEASFAYKTVKNFYYVHATLY